MSEVILGDCLEVMPTLADGSIDMILCDLPYGTTQNKWDSVIDLPALWSQYERIIKDNGAIVLTAQTPFDKVLGVSNLKLLKYEWIWEKTAATGHLNAKKMPMKAHENILVFYRGLPVYNPQMTSGHVFKSNGRPDLGNSKQSTNYGEHRQARYASAERYPRSVLKFAKDKQTSKLHPTQKPVALMEYLIRTYTNPGDLVLDNAFGSGTTGIAALNTGREFVGIESDEAYYDIAIERLVAHKESLRKVA